MALAYIFGWKNQSKGDGRMDIEKNMELWNMVCKTNPDDTKQFKGKGGFVGTAIDAQTQRRRATEIFGVFGSGWGIKDEVYTFKQFGEDSHYTKLFYTAMMYYNFKEIQGKIPIASEIDVFNYTTKYKTWNFGNDLYKKVRTDALTKGLSELGFNSDVFEGRFEDNKYIMEQRETFRQKESTEKPFDPKLAEKKIDELMQKLAFPMEYREQIHDQFEKAKTKADYTAIYKAVELEGETL